MERRFDIITDTGSDLPESYYEQHAIDCVPLGFTMDGVTYGGDDGEQLPVKEFYARLRAGAMPKTFQITPDQALKHIRPHPYRKLLHFEILPYRRYRLPRDRCS